MSSKFASEGRVTSVNCDSSNQAINKIVFAPKTHDIDRYNAVGIVSGTAEAGAINKTNATDLTGDVNATSDTVALDTTGTFGGGLISGPKAGKALGGGNAGGVTSGGVTTSPSAGTPPVYTGSGSMSCRWRLAKAGIYGDVDLGTRVTPCGTGNVSTSNQTGLRTYSCPSPTAAVDPIGTDTWSGGSCALTCSSRLGTGSFVTTSIGQRATSCPAGQQSTSNQTGTRTWTCGGNGGNAVNPSSIDTWTGGSCGVTCVPAARQTQSLGCPPNQVGAQSQYRDSYCPAPTGSATWGAWTTYSNTCAWNTSCQGYGSNYAWNGSSCQITCASVKPADAYLGIRATSCPAGQKSSADQVGYRRYSCPSTFGGVASVDQWTGGGCVPDVSVDLSGLPSNMQDHIRSTASRGAHASLSLNSDGTWDSWGNGGDGGSKTGRWLTGGVASQFQARIDGSTDIWYVDGFGREKQTVNVQDPVSSPWKSLSGGIIAELHNTACQATSESVTWMDDSAYLKLYIRLASTGAIVGTHTFTLESCGACFASGTQVQMSDGTWKVIDDIKEGDILASFTAKGIDFSKEGPGTWSSKNASDISLAPGRVTKVHPFFRYGGLELNGIKSTKEHVYLAHQDGEYKFLQANDFTFNTFLVGEVRKDIPLKSIVKFDEKTKFVTVAVSTGTFIVRKDENSPAILVHNRSAGGEGSLSIR